MKNMLLATLFLVGALSSVSAMAQMRNGFVICDHPKPTGCDYHGKLVSYTTFANEKLRFDGVIVSNMHYSFSRNKMVLYVQFPWAS